MKIGIQTWGSEGDIRPCIALAAGLRAAGHDVTVLATHVENRDYASEGRRYGVPVRSVGHLDSARLKETGEHLYSEKNVARQFSLVLHGLLEPVSSDIFQAARELCRESDLVIGHALVYPLRIAAEERDRPWVSLFPAPLLSTRTFSPLGSNFGPVANRLLWRVADAVASRRMLPLINGARRTAGRTCFRRGTDALRSPWLNIVAVSPSLVPDPVDWGEDIQLCGAFTLSAEVQDRQPSEIVERFLSTGPPPVYMTFGSMSAGDATFPATLELFVAAARAARCRAIVQTNGYPAPAGLEDVLFLDKAFHDEVFPRCAAVVHHGGAGTTHAACRAGKPSIVVEHLLDQAFWGRMLRRAGVTPRLLHRRKVTAASLGRAIAETLASPHLNDRAAALGVAMRKEDGVGEAVSLLEWHFARKE